ncbi:MAG: hypothetical protein WB511_12430 [Nitrososphaeraceae archaeon]
MPYKNSMHALRELLKSGEGKIRKIRTSSDQVHIAYDGSKYYFIEVCDNSSCHVIEADGEDAEELWKEATSIRNKHKIFNLLKTPV